jgi:hypothetical protein
MFRRIRILLTLMVLISAFAVILPQPSVAAASLVTVRVTIEEVRAVECFEGTFLGGCLGSADFYSWVKLGSDDGSQSPTADDDNDPSPGWQFQTTVDYNSVSTLPIYIEIRDEDGGLRLGDDLADVNGTPGIDKSVLDLTLHLGQVPCTITGDANGTCGIDITTQGNGDGDGTAALTFKVDVINTLPDADGDGIPDVWESTGVTLNGQFINLPAMGADPNKPDVFLQIDWMQDATHNQSLSSAAIQQVVNAFANSPYTSPTGSRGINLHVDEGSGSTLNFTTGATWGSLSKARSIPWQNNLGTLTGGQYDWTQFQAIKSANFDPSGRSPIFHYIIAGNYQEPPPSGGSQNGSSGISRGIGTSDLLITLGGFTGGVGTQLQQAGTLMHELGHNLGLKHGGNENTNYKPNYFSIMNYLYQVRGLDVGGTAGDIDYAGGTLPVLGPLNENTLNESNALGVSGFGVGSRCAAAGGGFTNQYTVTANGSFDWNCNGATTDGTVGFDANSSGGIDNNLTSYNDWANIQLRVGAIGDLGASSLPMLSDPEPELVWDLTPPTTTAQPVPGPNGYGWNRVTVSVTLHAQDNAGGFGVRDITYSTAGAQSIPSTTVIGDTTSFVISNEGVTTISYFAHDQALNVESTKTLVLNIDLTNPTVVLGTAYPAPNGAGWNNTDVNVPFTATDTLSGIASTTPPSSPLVLTAEGSAVTGTVTAVDKADNVTIVTTPAFKIDKTPPVITVSSPTPNQVFDSDQTMTPVFDATDALSGVKSVVAVLDTGQVVSSGTPIDLGLLVGQRTLTVTATDVADNVATVDIHFRVRPVFVGNAFNDPNESAMREVGEVGLGGVTVFLDNNGNGLPDTGEPSYVTGNDGAYRVVGEDVGPARICTRLLSSDRVRTTSRCQTVMVATGIPVPHTDFGSHTRTPGASNGSVANVIQSVALAGQPMEYWRPTALVGTANGPWAGSRLVVKNGGANPTVQVQTGERIATGLFIGGVDAARVGNLVLSVQAQPSNLRQVVEVVAADGSVATATTGPTTTFAYSQSGNILTIYGVPQDGLGGYQDIWLIMQVSASSGSVTTTAGIAGSVQVVNGQPTVKALGNTSNDTSTANIISGVAGTRSGALLVNDVPDNGTAINPF